MRHLPLRDGLHHLRERARDARRGIVFAREQLDLHGLHGGVARGEAREELGQDVGLGEAGA